MATERDVSMTIFGEVKSIEAVKELASAFESYVCPDWNEPQFDSDFEGIVHIVEALEEGKGIRVIRSSTGMQLDEISEVCRKHALSYEIMFEGDDLVNPYVNVWAPHFEDERTFECTDGGRPMIPIEDISKRIRKDPQNVLATLDEIERSALIGVGQIATATPELIAEINSLLEDDNEAAPAMAS